MWDNLVGEDEGRVGGHHSSSEPPGEQAASAALIMAVKEEVRVKGEFRMNDIDCARRHSFCSYKPATTILTNLQRGNVQTELVPVDSVALSLHQRAGMGDVTADQLPPADGVDGVDEAGLTALLWAAAYGQLPTVRLLLEHGADCGRLGIDGESALMLAACGGHFEVVRVLVLSGADVNLTDHFGSTALMYAAYSNSAHATHELLAAGADLTRLNAWGQSALSIAAASCSHLALSVLERHLTRQLLPRICDWAAREAKHLIAD